MTEVLLDQFADLARFHCLDVSLSIFHKTNALSKFRENLASAWYIRIND